MTLLKTKLLTKICGLVCSVTLFSASAQILPSAPQINAKGYFLVDYTTGKVIAEGESDTKLAPASLTKMMTSYVIGVEIEAGNISPCLLYTSPSPRDRQKSRMPSSA